MGTLGLVLIFHTLFKAHHQVNLLLEKETFTKEDRCDTHIYAFASFEQTIYLKKI